MEKKFYILTEVGEYTPDQVLTCKNVLEAWDEFNKEDHE